jgi:hypothetical protein
MGRIEGLPTVIFQMIQLHLSEKEYLQLMSCRKGAIDSVKQETARYSLCVNGTAEVALRRILESVKDKSTQISLRFYDMWQSQIKKFAKICDGAEIVSIIGNSHRYKFEDGLHLSVFNNILHLTLQRIHGISAFNLYLEKTVKLELVQCWSLMEITAWNSKNVLRNVVIQNCNCLQILPPLENVSEFSFSSNGGQHYSNFLVGKQQKLSYKGLTLSSQTWQLMSTETSFLSTMEELKLDLLLSLWIFRGGEILRLWNFRSLFVHVHIQKYHQSSMESNLR